MNIKEAPKSASSNTGDPAQEHNEQGSSGYSGSTTSSYEQGCVVPCDSSPRYSERSEVLGIVGGMGPLASTRFLESIYRFGTHTEEQNAPACILISDPRIVDRTQAVECGQQSLLLKALRENICQLEKAGATRFVIACFTVHSVISELPIAWRQNIISLVDLLMELISARSEPHLVLCTIGTRHARILETHPMWSNVKEHLILPSEEDQALIHNLIYKVLKPGWLESRQLKELDRLANKYEVRHLAVACTEFHLLQNSLASMDGGSWSFDLVDPLLFLARNLDRFLAGTTYVEKDEIING